MTDVVRAATERMAPHTLWTVRTLLFWLVLACLLPGVAGAVLLFIHQYQEGRAQQERDTIQTARALVQAVDSHLLKVQATGEALATSSPLGRGDLEAFHEQVSKVINPAHLAANVVLRDRKEQLVLNASQPFGQPMPGQPSREHVRRVFLTAKPAISSLYRVPQFNHPIISIDVPVLIGGRVEYALGLSVFPAQISSILATQKLPPGWVAAVLESTGTVVGRNISPEKFVGNKATPALMQALGRSREGSIEAVSQEGTPLQTAYSRSATTNWAVAIGIPRQSLQQALMLSLVRLASGIAVLFSIGLTLAWITSARIASSVRALRIPATALGRGEPVQRPQVHLKEAAEVGDAIYHAANLLQERAAVLQAREMELAQAHARLRDVIDSAPALIYLTSLDGEVLLVNKRYENLIGAKPGNTGMLDNRGWSSRDPDLLAGQRQALMRGEIVQFEDEVSTAEGTKYFAVSKAPLRDHADRMTGICVAAVDITPLKRAEAQVLELVATLEKRVEQRTEDLRVANEKMLMINQQLQDANNQLEAFSYTVAHDLRAPLRGIQGFADALMEDYEGKLDKTGQDYLQRVSRAAGRMEQLIDDLLSFSRLSRMELVLGPVSLDDILRQVLINLEAQIRETDAHVEFQAGLPLVYANRTACLQIFQNLVSNGLKFTRPGTPPRVRIWVPDQFAEHNGNDLVRIWVEDNGIGIAETQQQRIFRPFERLHGVSEYPGSGIGLAIVDKAARRMHGRCGVESEVNVGSRFWVELPAMAKEQ